jgi:phosphoenolpyruvate-protein phosphotransferase
MRVFVGVAISPGYGEGPALLYRGPEELLVFSGRAEPAGDAATEDSRVREALAAARRELLALSRRLEQDFGEAEARILHAQFFMLEDPHLLERIRDGIREGLSAERAVSQAVRTIEAEFDRNPDPYLRQRALDIHDVGVRILRHLTDRTHHPLASLPQDVVLLADQLLPSDSVFLDRRRVKAIVTARGGEHSHAAILARALGIPAVTQVAGILSACRDGEPVSVDGETGRVVVRLAGPLRDEYARRAARYRSAAARLQAEPTEAVTRDGTPIALLANVGRPEDATAAVERGAAGIGLLRTEFLFLLHAGAPTEEEQEAAFREVLRVVGDRPVTIRAFDFARDKILPPSEDAPIGRDAVDDRGIHYLLRHPEWLRPQLRAILRVARDGRVRLLLPMVTGVEEVRVVRALVDEASRALELEGVRVDPALPIGAMIETPPAVLMAEEIAREADFVSIGTNDLLHTMFCLERGSDTAIRRTAHEPSLLRAIARVVAAASDAGKEVSLCGEIAGDPAFTALLVGLGLRCLSMSSQRIAEVRYTIRQIEVSRAAVLAQEILSLDSAEAVRQRLADESDPWRRLRTAAS